MKRREFLNTSAKALCACMAGTGISLIQSCTNNVVESPASGGDGDELLIDITSTGFTALLTDGGSVITNGNSIDPSGLVLLRVSDGIRAFQNRCTHSSYPLQPFNNGVAMCTSGHGGSFNTNGQGISPPAYTSLKEYTTSLEGNDLTVFS